MEQPTKEASLDDCALTLREVLRHHTSAIKDALDRVDCDHNPSAVFLLNECGVEMMVSARLLKLFLVEEALT